MDSLKRARHPIAAALALAGWVLAGPALAVDGAIEINQDKIMAGDVTGTGADLPGYPATLDVSGGYVLTGNLLGTPGANGLDVVAPDVTIDLNGFSVTGPIGPAGGEIGIADLNPFPFGGVSVVNGIVREWPTDGISLGQSGRVERVYARDNGAVGIRLVDDGMVIKSNVRGNGNSGIQCQKGCKIENNVCVFNGQWGIQVFDTGTILANTASMNGPPEGGVGGGISSGNNSTVGDNTANMNNGPGIQGDNGCRVNGNTTGSNSNSGILMGDYATINDNSAAGNQWDGIVCGQGCAINENAANHNGSPDQVAGDGIRALDGSGINHNTTMGNFGDGIDCGLGCNINGNTAYKNLAFGLNLPAASPVGVYRQNVFIANVGGDVSVLALDVTSPAQNNVCTGLGGGVVPCP